MGIYAPGITKPDHCCNCQFCEDSTDDCLLQNDAHWSTYSEQIKNCPLIEIPEPHGQLIDASYKVDMPFYDDEYEENSVRTVTVEELLMMADNEVPTVIEAEGSENHDD